MISIRPQYVARAFLAVLVGAFIFTILNPGRAAPEVGKLTADFELPGLDGRTVKLSDYRGKVVVLNFWATWCPPCVEEMPSLNRFQEVFAARGVAVLAVSVDDDEEALRRFVADHQLKMTIARDPGRKASTLYQTYKYPESYILDRQGRLVEKMVGPADWNDQRLLTLFGNLTG